MLTHIYMYDQHSEMGNAIAERLGLLRIRHNNSTFVGNKDTVVLNWGSSDLPLRVRRAQVINNERAVYNAVNKYRALSIMQDAGIPVPYHTKDIHDASNMLHADGAVYQRMKLTGHDGDGCSLIEDDGETVLNMHAKLWTKAIHIDHEYRVTKLLADRCAVGIQVKVPDGTRDDPDMNVRTTAGGWGFRPVRQGNPHRERLTRLADLALSSLDLHFGGVDIIKSGDEFYVLEVNTAPVMTPYVLDNFCEAIEQRYG